MLPQKEGLASFRGDMQESGFHLHRPHISLYEVTYYLRRLTTHSTNFISVPAKRRGEDILASVVPPVKLETVVAIGWYWTAEPPCSQFYASWFRFFAEKILWPYLSIWKRRFLAPAQAHRLTCNSAPLPAFLSGCAEVPHPVYCDSIFHSFWNWLAPLFSIIWQLWTTNIEVIPINNTNVLCWWLFYAL
jgi:hypothetical protein